MITPFDPFEHDRMIYTVKNGIRELPDVEYEDGATTLFLYTKGNPRGASEELQKLLRYMEESVEENVTTEAIRRIHDMVETVKQDKEVSEKYMKVLEREEKLKEKSKKEGIKEGRKMEQANTEREKRRADEATERADAETKRADEATERADAETQRADEATERAAKYEQELNIWRIKYEQLRGQLQNN